MFHVQKDRVIFPIGYPFLTWHFCTSIYMHNYTHNVIACSETHKATERQMQLKPHPSIQIKEAISLLVTMEGTSSLILFKKVMTSFASAAAICDLLFYLKFLKMIVFICMQLQNFIFSLHQYINVQIIKHFFRIIFLILQSACMNKSCGFSITASPRTKASGNSC